MSRPIELAVETPFVDMGSFLDHYGGNLSRWGIFIESPSIQQPGTEVHFQVFLRDSSTIFSGEGIVRWGKKQSKEVSNRKHGMAIQFTRLSLMTGSGVLGPSRLFCIYIKDVHESKCYLILGFL